METCYCENVGALAADGGGAEQRTAIRVARGQAKGLLIGAGSAAGDVTLRCLEGTAWVTLEGAAQDIVLRAGERTTLHRAPDAGRSRKARLVVQSLGDGEAVVRIATPGPTD